MPSCWKMEADPGTRADPFYDFPSQGSLRRTDPGDGKKSKRSAGIFTCLCSPAAAGSLEEMNRRYDKEHYLDLVDKIRAAMPDISLTTDIIVGFPGETKKIFRKPWMWWRRFGYDTAFTFIYSKRTGTPAAVMEDQIPGGSGERSGLTGCLKLVQEIGREGLRDFSGTVQEVLVEEESQFHGKGCITGRMSHNLLVHFPGDTSLIWADTVTVRLGTVQRILLYRRTDLRWLYHQ